MHVTHSLTNLLILLKKYSFTELTVFIIFYYTNTDYTNTEINHDIINKYTITDFTRFCLVTVCDRNADIQDRGQKNEHFFNSNNQILP